MVMFVKVKAFLSGTNLGPTKCINSASIQQKQKKIQPARPKKGKQK
jgi:hypothetical protein